MISLSRIQVIEVIERVSPSSSISKIWTSSSNTKTPIVNLRFSFKSFQTFTGFSRKNIIKFSFFLIWLKNEMGDINQQECVFNVTLHILQFDSLSSEHTCTLHNNAVVYVSIVCYYAPWTLVVFRIVVI